MSKAKDEVFLAKGREALVSRLDAQLQPADDEGSVAQFLEAEAVVDQYLAAVNDGAPSSLPVAEELAFSCALLLVVTQTIQAGDIERLARLNTPELGVSLFAMAADITEMKTRAVAGLAQMAAGDEPPVVVAPAAGGDVPF